MTASVTECMAISETVAPLPMACASQHVSYKDTNTGFSAVRKASTCFGFAKCCELSGACYKQDWYGCMQCSSKTRRCVAGQLKYTYSSFIFSALYACIPVCLACSTHLKSILPQKLNGHAKYCATRCLLDSGVFWVQIPFRIVYLLISCPSPTQQPISHICIIAPGGAQRNPRHTHSLDSKLRSYDAQ